MSIHPSLRGVDTLRGERSVFTRVERIQYLLREGKLGEEASPYGLPKVRTRFKVKRAKRAPDAEAPAADAAAGAAAADSE